LAFTLDLALLLGVVGNIECGGSAISGYDSCGLMSMAS